MAKYVVAVLAFIVGLIGLILFIGESSELVIKSTSLRPFLNFETIVSWRITIVALTLLVLLLFALWALISFLIRLPKRVKSGVGLRRRTQALEAMEDALIAGTQGDKSKARKKAEKARNLISSPALGRMISAQAAEAANDGDEAIAQYKSMLDDERTRMTAQRGLARHMLGSGDISGAITHSKQAYEDNKDAPWAFDILFQALVSDCQWQEALNVLDKGIARKHMDKQSGRRRRAVLQTAMADQYHEKANMELAKKYALAAVADAADFAPAISLASQILAKDGQTKKAASLIEKAWASTPHPALALSYRDLYGSEVQKVRDRKIKALIKNNPDHRESKILEAEEALMRGDAVQAWSVLTPLLSDTPVSARLCMLASANEAKLKNLSDARLWLERAASAPSEPDWTDIDPQGDGFDYTDSDWRRLVFSYGETGALIHPRFEAGAARRPVMKDVKAPSDDTELAIKEPAVSETVQDPNAKSDTEPFRQPDDPGSSSDGPLDKKRKDDLAERLGNLLGDKGADS